MVVREGMWRGRMKKLEIWSRPPAVEAESSDFCFLETIVIPVDRLLVMKKGCCLSTIKVNGYSNEAQKRNASKKKKRKVNKRWL